MIKMKKSIKYIILQMMKRIKIIKKDTEINEKLMKN